MKIRSLVIALLVSLTASSLLALEGQTVSLITTKSGKTYTHCRIFKHDPDGVLFSHALGGAKILYADMSDSMRDQLGYDADKAQAYTNGLKQKREAERQEWLELRTETLRAQAAASAAELKRLEVFGQDQPYGSSPAQTPYLGWTSFYPNQYWPTGQSHDRSIRGENYASRTILPSNNCPPPYINRVVRRSNVGNGYMANRAVPFGVPALSHFVAPPLAPRAATIGGVR